MRTREFFLAVCAGAWLWPAAADAETLRLTLSDALMRAREQAPRIVSARLALEEARARLLGAGTRPNNPELDVGLGRRSGETASTDVELGIQQMLEPAGRRRARMAAATEGVAQGTAIIEDTTRQVLADVAAAFLRALHASAQINLLTAAEALASQVHAAAHRRFKAGDIPVLDVNIARASLARARADRQSAAATLVTTIGELKQLLGIEVDVTIEGSLAPPEPIDLAGLQGAAARRPEIRQLEAAVREAEAEARIGASYRRPGVGVSARYEREEGDNVLLGGVTVSLPMFARGQELVALGGARAGRLRAELEAARVRIRTEVAAAGEAYKQRAEAVRLLQDEGLPGLDENERLTTRSFEVGQIGLAELLLIRREILDTRFQYLDTLLEAALARVYLHASAAVLR